MELISEEELSICRSEGSPPRKAKKRRVIASNQGNQQNIPSQANFKKLTSSVKPTTTTKRKLADFKNKSCNFVSNTIDDDDERPKKTLA